MSGRKKQDSQRLQWHPAFGAALRITFAEEIERKELELQEEYLLSKKPPQIDVLIIKKRKDALIRKTIGRIFRQHNIVEYKAPDDNLSVNDFYKVYGYACFYQSNTNRIRQIEPTEITITFVCNRYPRERSERNESGTALQRDLLPERRCGSHAASDHARTDPGGELLAAEPENESEIRGRD